jgi:hypothetical protein
VKINKEIEKYNDENSEAFFKLKNNYKKKIGQWKNKKLPSFFDIVLRTQCKDGKNFEHMIQMLLIRALLCIKYNHKSILTSDMESHFLGQLREFRQEIEKLFEKNSKKDSGDLIRKQLQYLIPIRLDILKNSKDHNMIENLMHHYQELIGNNMFDSEIFKILSQKFQEWCKKAQVYNPDIVRMFNNKEYKQVIEVINNQKALVYYPRYVLVQFIAALKLNEDKLIKQYFKLLNRNLANFLAPFKDDFEKIVQDTDDLEKCIEKISKFLGNVGK